MSICTEHVVVACKDQNLYKKLARVSVNLVQVFLVHVFLHIIVHSSVPSQKLPGT